MTCLKRDDLLRLESGAIAAAAAAELRAHAEGCVSCATSLRLLEHARQTMRAHLLEPTAGAAGRVWNGIDERRHAGRWRWRALTIGASLVAASGALLLAVGLSWQQPDLPRVASGRVVVVDGSMMLRAGDALPVMAPLRVDAPTELDLGLARVSVGVGSTLRIENSGTTKVALRLEHGDVRVRVQKLHNDQSFRVATQHCRVDVMGTQFNVRVDSNRTHVSVQEGLVWVHPPTSEGESVRLAAGEWLVVPALVPAKPEATAPRRDAAKRSSRAGTRRRSSERETLAAARVALQSDVSQATEIVSELLATNPGASVEAQALMILADADRLRSRFVEASARYGEVAVHPGGRPLAEEAMLQRALLLAHELGDDEAALEVLSLAARAHAAGPLVPERASLAARLHLKHGRIEQAAEVLEAVHTAGMALRLLETRLDVARALVTSAPGRVAAVLKPVLAPSVVPAALRRRAEKIMDMANSALESQDPASMHGVPIEKK